jgi:hypothetical protein
MSPEGFTVTQAEDTGPDDSPTAERNSSPSGSIVMSHAEMNAAYNSGAAIPLAQAISWLVRYRDAWWVVYERGWLLITDDLTAADLDQATARLSEADAIAARDAAIRTALDAPRIPAGEAEL